jgi:CBS domain-containing protein
LFHGIPDPCVVLSDTALLNKQEMSPSISVRQSTALDTIISKLAATRVHRLFVVNDDHVPVGAVSLTDICRVTLMGGK